MVTTYSSDLKERIIWCYYQGETMRSIAKIFNVSVGFVHHVVDLHRKYGQVMDPYTQPWTGHQILTSADENYIHTLIDERLSIYLDEIQDPLFFEHTVYVSLTTISQTLARMQFSKKSLLCKAAERNESVRTTSAEGSSSKGFVKMPKIPPK